MKCYAQPIRACLPAFWSLETSSLALGTAGGGDPATVAVLPSVTDWSVQGADVLVVAVFVLLFFTVWLLRGALLTTLYNAALPRMWQVRPLTLGVGLALSTLLLVIFPPR
jgi:hypothetical protein